MNEEDIIRFSSFVSGCPTERVQGNDVASTSTPQKFVRLMSIASGEISLMRSAESFDKWIEGYCTDFCDIVTVMENFVEGIIYTAEGS